MNFTRKNLIEKKGVGGIDNDRREVPTVDHENLS